MPTLTELKARANELKLSLDYVRSFGSLSHKATWEQAITESERYNKEQEEIKQYNLERYGSEIKPEIGECNDSVIVSSSVTLITEDNPFNDSDDWLEGGLEDAVTSDHLASESEVVNTSINTIENSAYLYETKNYAVVNNTIFEGFSITGFTFILKPETIVYNPKTTRPLWIAQLDDAKKTCDELQEKFDIDQLKNDDLAEVLDDTHTIIDGEYVMKSEVCPVNCLQSLRLTDQRFKYYQDWMLPGAKFTTGHQTYVILYLDLYGNVHAKGTDQHWHCFSIETIVNCRVYSWHEVLNQNVKPTLSMLYKPTIINRKTRLKSENNSAYRDMSVLYDRSFLVWRLSSLLSEFGHDDKALLKGLFDDVLLAIIANEHNSELLEAYGMKSGDDE